MRLRKESVDSTLLDGGKNRSLMSVNVTECDFLLPVELFARMGI